VLAVRIDGSNKHRDRQISREGNLSKCLPKCILQPNACMRFADSADRNKITFGNGNGDEVVQTGSGHAIIGNTIILGNGQADRVQLTDSFDDRIFLGNGDNDSVTISRHVGQDTIWTGTGSSNFVNVGPHIKLAELADTFGFALGTNGSSFTTISGAQKGDHLIAGKGSDLGDTPVQ
jgi:hypothetical protein